MSTVSWSEASYRSILIVFSRKRFEKDCFVEKIVLWRKFDLGNLWFELYFDEIWHFFRLWNCFLSECNLKELAAKENFFVRLLKETRS